MPMALLKHKYESNAGQRAAHSQAALISQSISTDGGLSSPQSSEVYTERHAAQGLLSPPFCYDHLSAEVLAACAVKPQPPSSPRIIQIS